MRLQTNRLALGLFLSLSFTPACNSPEPAPAAPSAAPTSAAPAAPKPAAPAPTPAAAEVKETKAKGKAERMAVAVFSKNADGSEKLTPVLFHVTNNGPSTIDSTASFAYYYDKGGKLLKKGDTFSCGDDIAKGKTEEVTLAWKSDTPPGTDKIEVEIVEVDYKDGSVWTNDALNDDKRPLGGIKK